MNLNQAIQNNQPNTGLVQPHHQQHQQQQVQQNTFANNASLQYQTMTPPPGISALPQQQQQYYYVPQTDYNTAILAQEYAVTMATLMYYQNNNPINIPLTAPMPQIQHQQLPNDQQALLNQLQIQQHQRQSRAIPIVHPIQFDDAM